MSSKMWLKAILVSVQFFLQTQLVDRVLFRIENHTYTLFDLKSGCIAHYIVNIPSQILSCLDGDFLVKNVQENFINRELIWITFQPEMYVNLSYSKIDEFIESAGKSPDFLEILEKVGITEKRLREEIRKELIVKRYVEERFGDYRNAESYLKLIEKSAKIKIYFNKMPWREGFQKRK